MKKNIKVLGLLPFVLISPALMAVIEENICSHINYSDFEVTVKTLKEDLYELTINNYGEAYIVKDRFVKDNKYYFNYVPETEYEGKRTTFIKPNEIKTIKVKPEENSYGILEEGKYTDFTQCAYLPKNDYISIEGPYNLSFTKHEYYGGDYNTLDINCNLTKLKFTSPGNHYSYMYSYAVTWTYDGTEFCTLSMGKTTFDDAISLYFEPDIKLDTSLATISNIDAFIETGIYEPSKCGGLVGPVNNGPMGFLLMGAAIVGGVTLIIVAAYFSIVGIMKIIKMKRKKNNSGEQH